MSKRLDTVEAIVVALEGPTKAAAALGESRPSVVTNWLARGKLPFRKFREQKTRLAELGIEAPDALWLDFPAPTQDAAP